MIRSIAVRTLSGALSGCVRTGEEIVFDVSYDCGDAVVDVVQVQISTTQGGVVFTVGTHLSGRAPDAVTGRGQIACHIGQLPLIPGEYDVSVMMTQRMPWHDVDCIDSALRFEVAANDYYGTGLHPGPEQGATACRSVWTLQPDLGNQLAAPRDLDRVAEGAT